ncbi:ribosomal-protein-alanine N-acetyltransferase [Gammaproteobacteria bacterium 42_54_T18]|nr:ribosomal-protein-alanine N-acetyltransferase [Gammaproteobacteria bacterium 42_54_T18]
MESFFSCCEVKNLSVDDVSEMMRIEQRAYAFPWTENVLKDCLQGAYLCRGLMLKGVLCAYAILSVAVGECHVLNICVSPDVQGQGVASDFLRKLLDEAVEWNAEIAFLEVRESNVAALALYSKLGFSEIGRRKAYYRNGDSREDALVLSLPLV